MDRIRFVSHKGQRVLLIEDVVGRPAVSNRLIGVLVRDDGCGAKVSWVADRCQIIFGVDQPC